MEKIFLYLITIIIGIIIIIMIYKRIYEITKKEIESHKVILKVVNKYNRRASERLGGRQNTNLRGKYFFTILYNEIVEKVEVDSFCYNNTEINDEINGFYKIYRDIKGEEIERIEI